MSSGTATSAVNVEDLPTEGGEGGGWQSERQRHLTRLYAHFRAKQYDGRSCDWDGTPATAPEEADTISRTGVLPAGFEMHEELTETPLRFRKPCSPVALGRAIPLKLTSMLFGAKKHPKILCDDPITEDWLAGFAEVTRLWSKMKQARNNGGSMGSVALGFKFAKGKPLVEVHDPKWCTPTFQDRSELLVERFEKRYQYSEQVLMPDGGYETMWFWYRRVITDQYDVIWPRVVVQEGEEPRWLQEKYDAVKHAYGYCPIVWIQNTAVDEEIDGDPDCHGVFDLIHSIDMLNSQARRGTLANMDPTLGITSDAEFDPIRKGTGHSVQVEKGGALNYLEMTGTGITLGCKLRDDMQEQICTVARVALDRNEGGPSRTVEEIEHVYSSMLENCDELREQYGELGVKRLLDMVLSAARQLSGTQIETDQATGMKTIVRSVIKLPKRRVKNEDTGEVTWVERKLGSGTQLELKWPKYFTPSQESISAAVTAAGTAKTFGLIDQKHATGHVAEDFDIENVGEVIKNIGQEQQAAGEAGPGGGGAGDDLASTVTQRTLSGARNPLPDPRAKQLAAVAKRAAV